MSALTLIQHHCRLHALRVPESVLNSTDTGVQQLYAILLDVIKEIVEESDFNVSTQEALFVAKPVHRQGSLSALAPLGFVRILPGTIFDRLTGLEVCGPLSEVAWQSLMAKSSVLSALSYRIKNDDFYLYPAGQEAEIAFEYISKFSVWGLTLKGKPILQETILKDTDGFVFPDNLLQRGLSFRWKQIKGLPYLEDQKVYYNLLNNYIARDKVKSSICLSPPEFRGSRMLPRQVPQ